MALSWLCRDAAALLCAGVLIFLIGHVYNLTFHGVWSFHTGSADKIDSTLLYTVTEEDAELFGRNIPKQAVNKSVAVVSMFFIIASLSTIFLSAVTDADVIDIVYETVSATATVGLTRDLTSTLNLWGKLIIIVTMYLGRVGPISLVVAFSTRKKNKNIVKNPTEEISVG